ncbi:ribonuclease HIII [Enterococcus raffinosus]|uniref:Ribonuclease HIII n=1 Tax=Enterococcus raffinosus TaxID=71452 RepID=A0AAW8TFH8_9ENTE|nr:ribonuclease HIII [Enterococcus raffinosus]MDT2525057.1 ribonuclease HIII [Enterococcus raffinosus]MDT2531384.1 ribonuclease HIII [Enterococcus raffinosus]MDT2534541.1 ribonuclease HIII [Enterococcus raffinosus]MDT2545593.1 ribonuclease HIII [Enterococcus raffinosus]MDT2555537.1 ribonuclease HIII [Enterococcus raffinosus]
MSSTVLKLSKTEIQKLKSYYTDYLLNKKVPYSEFSAKKNGTSITAYTSGKVLFQGNNAEQEAAKWGKSESSTVKKSTSLPENFSSLSVLGSDEVGNGSYFGPLCVCAAYVDKEHLSPLKKLGVKDSKMLTDDQIRKMAITIKKLIPYKLLVVNPEKYNEIQPKYNAVRMKVALHNQAIRILLEEIEPVKPDAILIDQFTSEANYMKYVKQEAQRVNQKIYFVTKGEQYHLAVAAASIISRASFLEELDKASVELGRKVPSGAGKPSDELAADLIRQGGTELLSKYVKLHFANTEKAKKLV